MNRYLLAILVLLAVAPTPSSGDPCTINFVSHGVFQSVVTEEGNCLKFVDDLGVSWEVTNPRGAWNEGLTGTIFAEILSADSGDCSQDVGEPLKICIFDSDVTRNIVGALDFLTPFETNCPGWYLRVNGPPTLYRVVNCEDFGTELCDATNEGRRVQVTAFVDNGITNCISPAATVFEFRFLS
jgi:hypothetical protein